MLVYEGIKKDFLDSVYNETIAEEIETKLLTKMNRHTARNEFKSWENSLKDMYVVMNDCEIPDDCGVAIEYNIPQTSKRVDFLISGYDDSNKGNVIIVELKQWSDLKAVEGKDALVETYTGNALRQVVHPSYQAWSYAALIKDYNESVQKEDIKLRPCAYLHNYRRINNDPVDSIQYQTYIDEAPVFTKGQKKVLSDFIKQFIKKGDQKKLLYEVDNGKIKPSKSLQDTISSMIKGNQEFVMLDEQKVAYEQIIALAKESNNDNHKRVIIVQGGPGTGKSVIAINALATLTNMDQVCQYVSKNSAPRYVYCAKLKAEMKKSSINNMFKGSGSYVEADSNVIDTILVDEAHRLNEKSGMFSNLGENQIKEIINASKCSVFFIDESQRVTLKDCGSIKEIEKWANKYDAQVYHMQLKSQFRCNGSDGYLAWLDNTLQIRESANWDLEGMDYDFKVIEDPNELRRLIEEKNKLHNKARMVAGYCWEWNKAGKNNSEVYDIEIGTFKMSWNLNNTFTYAIDETSINEVGCIHTTQGLEFDYVGVIIGEDIRYENGHIVTDFTKRAKTDQSLKGIKKLAKNSPIEASKVADEIIKNTYRTLMTRGMKGCYVYCCDKRLAQYLKECSKRNDGD